MHNDVSNKQIRQPTVFFVSYYVLKNTQHFGQQTSQQQGSWRGYGTEH